MTDEVKETVPEPAAPASRRGLLRPLQHERGTGERERFLSTSRVVALTAYGLFALTFASFKVQRSEADGEVYYNLLRRFFGEHPDFAFAYQFGSDIWNTPFFLGGKGLAAIFGYQPHTFHVSIQEISITVATNVAFVATLYLGWRILRELDLPRGGAVLLLTAFGSPLFYYVVFAPAAKHSVDTLVLTAVALVLLRSEQGLSTRHAAALGALAGWSVNIRYVNTAFFVAVAVALALRGERSRLALAVGVAALVGIAIFSLPALRGISYFVPSYFPKSDGVVRLAAPVSATVVASTSNPLNGFDALNPLRMLFSEHRGLFTWTPLTALACVGFALAWHRARATRVHAGFLTTILAAALALLATHMIWGQWDGGLAFSQRFLTGLFPIYLIGVAELVRRWGAIVYVALAVCVAWAVAAAFVHNVGYDRISENDGIGRIAEVARTDPQNMSHKVWRDARKRWAYMWGLAHGYDPEHVNDRG